MEIDSVNTVEAAAGVSSVITTPQHLRRAPTGYVVSVQPVTVLPDSHIL